MGIPQEVDDYIRESIEGSLGLPMSEKTLRLKLLASEDERHRLKDQIFFLQDKLKESHMRLQLCKEEATMNAQGLRNCIQDKEIITEKCTEMENYCANLERECMLLERDTERVQALAAEVKSLQEDKENLRLNLQSAEEEVKLLFEVNRLLDEENKRLLKKLQKDTQQHGSDSKPYVTSDSCSTGKRKLSLLEGSPCGKHIDFNSEEQLRQPFTPLHQNSPQPSIKVAADYS